MEKKIKNEVSALGYPLISYPYDHHQRGFDIGRAQSCVLRLPKYWPPTPLSTRRVCPPPAPKAGGTHSLGGEGGWGSIFWKTQDIGLASYSNNLSTNIIIFVLETWSHGRHTPTMYLPVIGIQNSGNPISHKQPRTCYKKLPPGLLFLTFERGVEIYATDRRKKTQKGL
jgi:hypothetical protein